jgi:hypothetical protein
MENLAWELLENKKDIVAAEKVFSALANRAKLRSSAKSVSEKDFDLIQTHKMITTIMTLFFPEELLQQKDSNENHHLNSTATTTSLTADQCRSLAAAVLDTRIPSFVLFGCPESADELSRAHRGIQLFVHPDKGHVKTPEAFIKLGDRKEECLDQMEQILKERIEEAQKKEARKQQEDLIRTFSESIRKHDFIPLMNPSDLQQQQQPFSSIPTGQNMFTLHHHHHSQQQQPKSPSPRKQPVQEHHHQENVIISSEFENSTKRYHLPPLQPRYATKLTNSSSPPKQHNGVNGTTTATTTTSSSFASPTKKPNPMERSGMRPPSATKHIQQHQKHLQQQQEQQHSPLAARRRGEMTLHEKNKQKTKEKEFDSLMSQLRQQKSETQSKMNGCYRILGKIQKDHVEQEQEELMKTSVTSRNDFENSTNGPTLNYTFSSSSSNGNSEQQSSSMIELTMKALLSKLKTQNSNVKINCSVSSTHHSENETVEQETLILQNHEDHHHPQNDNKTSSSPTADAVVEEEEHGSHHENCRDFVVKRLGQVLQCHLKSLGSEIIDSNDDDLVQNVISLGGGGVKQNSNNINSGGTSKTIAFSPPSSSKQEPKFKNHLQSMLPVNHQGVSVVNKTQQQQQNQSPRIRRFSTSLKQDLMMKK